VKSPDVIIAGAGLIGVSIALELGRRGAQVLVLDRGEPGRESTSAAAGMLAAADPETPKALRPLSNVSAQLYPEFVAQIEGASGINVDFRQQGTIQLSNRASLAAPFHSISLAELKRLEPALEPGGLEAFFVEESSVDPLLLIQGALVAAARAGIEIRGKTEVHDFVSRRGHVELVLASERLAAPTVVNCRGAWSGYPVRPRKGHALYLQPPPAGAIEHVVVSPEVYLVPRSSGKVLVGATVEDVGYDKTVDPDTVKTLHAEASRLVPEAAHASVLASWAGLRPGTPDDLPVLGATKDPGILIASGHFRNGILLAPVTARILADLVAGTPPEWDISAFTLSRFAAAVPGEKEKPARPRHFVKK
jgi:glycine oxidase